MRSLVVGMSGSGKSSAMRVVAERGAAAGVPVLVCDPHGTQWPMADWVTDDIARFVACAQANVGCLLLVDEANEAIGPSGTNHERACRWLATGTRKWGHRLWLGSTGYTEVARAYRRQCDPVVIMRQAVEDATELAKLYRDERLLQAETLEPGQFYLRRDGVVTGPHRFPRPKSGFQSVAA